MTFAFPAYHQEDISFPMPITHDWVVYACHTGGLGTVRWAPNMNAWVASPSVSVFSWGETMTMTLLAPNALRIRSECGLPTQCIDWGKNEKNVKRLIEILWAALRQPQPPFR